MKGVTEATDDETLRLRERVRDLEAALGQNDNTLAVTFRLTPKLSNLLGLLLQLPNVTPEMIQHRLEIASDAKVAMHRLRVHLKSWGVVVHSRRHLGYWLDGDTKERIRALASGNAAPPDDVPVVDVNMVEPEEARRAA